MNYISNYMAIKIHPKLIEEFTPHFHEIIFGLHFYTK